jgi:hypothetical protein
MLQILGMYYVVESSMSYLENRKKIMLIFMVL